MNTIPAHLRPTFAPQPHPQAVVTGPQVRFTVLTSRLLRLEYAPAGLPFEDRPSQVFWYREQPPPPFEVTRGGDEITIETEHLRLQYRPQAGEGFTADTLSIELLGQGVTWRYGDPNPGNLLGTTRTLDKVSGQTKLEQGLLSREGWAVWDDSQSLVFNEQGWLEPRPEAPPTSQAPLQDLYFFGYGQEYTACLQDFMRVAGRVPLVPRWILGNWWSRYWAYDEAELTALMQEFREQEVPLSVCIIDMDWHLTQTGNRSSGWTGYTWNRELFPDPPRFLQWLHDQGLRTALNLHPAEGVHPHEAQYEAMAEAMGVDPQSQEPIPFDIASPAFALPYLTLLHHPLEVEGVDFWWLDWQQGTRSSLPGLDPLWWLNHIHFYDLGRDGRKRPFVFSRWGGLGNHRYPIGFSGDTFVNWPSLAFQPYFTATAANVGYSWWSHDIGGHMFGMEDAELYTRWVQYGVFSPIFRLHSTKNPFHDRRPWGYDAETLRLTRQAMQLRHALIPYLYTLAWQNHQEGIAAIRPLYHDYPQVEAAYHCPNQYTFGPHLFAAPYVAPRDTDTGLSRQVVWFPAGTWYNFFTGERQEGPCWQALYGTLADIPVFARAGAIVPLGPMQGWGGVDNPELLEVLIFPGAAGHFELYEDDGETMAFQDGACALTPMSQAWQEGTLTFTIGPAVGDTSLIPGRRAYSLRFRGMQQPEQVRVALNGEEEPRPVPHAYDPATHTVQLAAIRLRPEDKLVVTLDDVRPAPVTGRVEKAQGMLRHFRLETGTKASLAEQMAAIADDFSLLENYALPLRDSHRRALLETLTAAGMDVSPHGNQRRLILWNNDANPAITFSLNGFNELRWHSHRLYRPEGGIVPPQHILSEQELATLGRWQCTLHYKTVLSVRVGSQEE